MAYYYAWKEKHVSGCHQPNFLPRKERFQRKNVHLDILREGEVNDNQFFLFNFCLGSTLPKSMKDYAHFSPFQLKRPCPSGYVTFVQDVFCNRGLLSHKKMRPLGWIKSILSFSSLKNANKKIIRIKTSNQNDGTCKLAIKLDFLATEEITLLFFNALIHTLPTTNEQKEGGWRKETKEEYNPTGNINLLYIKASHLSHLSKQQVQLWQRRRKKHRSWSWSDNDRRKKSNNQRKIHCTAHTSIHFQKKRKENTFCV